MKVQFDFRDYVSYEQGKKFRADLNEEQLRQADIMYCFSQEDRFVLWLLLIPGALSFDEMFEDWEDTSESLIRHIGCLLEKGLLYIEVKNGVPHYGVIVEWIDPWICELLSGLVPYSVTANVHWFQFTGVDPKVASLN